MRAVATVTLLIGFIAGAALDQRFSANGWLTKAQVQACIKGDRR